MSLSEFIEVLMRILPIGNDASFPHHLKYSIHDRDAVGAKHNLMYSFSLDYVRDCCRLALITVRIPTLERFVVSCSRRSGGSFICCVKGVIDCIDLVKQAKPRG